MSVKISTHLQLEISENGNIILIGPPVDR